MNLNVIASRPPSYTLIHPHTPLIHPQSLNPIAMQMPNISARLVPLLLLFAKDHVAKHMNKRNEKLLERERERENERLRAIEKDRERLEGKTKKKGFWGSK